MTRSRASGMTLLQSLVLHCTYNFVVGRRRGIWLNHATKEDRANSYKATPRSFSSYPVEEGQFSVRPSLKPAIFRKALPWNTWSWWSSSPSPSSTADEATQCVRSNTQVNLLCDMRPTTRVYEHDLGHRGLGNSGRLLHRVHGDKPQQQHLRRFLATVTKHFYF